MDEFRGLTDEAERISEQQDAYWNGFVAGVFSTAITAFVLAIAILLIVTLA